MTGKTSGDGADRGGRARLVVVLCPERSGSTVLSVLLGGHSRVLAPPEMHLLRFADLEEMRRDYPVAMSSLRHVFRSLGLPADDATILESLGGMSSDRACGWILDRLGSERVLVDKTPAYSRREEALARCESLEPFYVWLVRHPLGVAASRTARRREKRRGQNTTLGARLSYPFYWLRWSWRRWTGKWVRWEVNEWGDAHRTIERFLETVDGARWRRVHFEDVLHRPEETLSALCEALGLDFEPSMLEIDRHLPSGTTWGIGDGKIRQTTGVDPSVADRWRERQDESALGADAAALYERLRRS